MTEAERLVVNNEFLGAIVMTEFWRAVRKRTSDGSFGQLSVTLSWEAGIITQATFDDRLPMKPAAR